MRKAGISKKRRSIPVQLKRLRVLIALLLLMVSGVLFRAFQIQIIGDSRIERMASRQVNSRVLIRPKRGMIVDRENKALAINAETSSLAANPSKISKLSKKERSRIIIKLGNLTKISQKKINLKLKGKKEFVWIKRHLPTSAKKDLQKLELMNKAGQMIDGLWLVNESRRHYPFKEVASHVLGAVNIDSTGIEGIELTYNKKLKGKIVSVKTQRDAMGRPAFLDAKAATHVRTGETIQLSIDSSLQFSVEKELKNSVEKTKSRSGSVLVMDAVSGEILVMANHPTFDANQRGSSAKKRRNRLLTDGYEPGSTLKPLLMAAALESGWTADEKIFGENGSVKIQGKRISEAESHEKFKWLTLADMVKFSSNVGAAKFAIKLGAEKFLNTLRALEFGKKSGIEFPGEIKGWIPRSNKIQPLSLATMGFGQGLFVSPIQIAKAYAAVLNGGWLVRPSLIKGKQSKPKRIFSIKTSAETLKALESAVAPGATGRNAMVTGYRIAGKTGTAQVVDPKTRRYSQERYIATFVGFGLGLESKYVILTMLDFPKEIYYASETAAPLFANVFAAMASRYNFPNTTSKPIKMAMPPKYETRDEVKTSVAVTVPSTKHFIVPNLTGLTSREVFYRLKDSGMILESKGFGLVQEQYPLPGTNLKKGSHLKITLGTKAIENPSSH